MLNQELSECILVRVLCVWCILYMPLKDSKYSTQYCVSMCTSGIKDNGLISSYAVVLLCTIFLWVLIDMARIQNVHVLIVLKIKLNG